MLLIKLFLIPIKKWSELLKVLLLVIFIFTSFVFSMSAFAIGSNCSGAFVVHPSLTYISDYWSKKSDLYIFSSENEKYAVGLSYDIEVSFEGMRRALQQSHEHRPYIEELEPQISEYLSRDGKFQFKDLSTYVVKRNPLALKLEELSIDWFSQQFGFYPNTEIDGDPLPNLEFKHPSFETKANVYFRQYSELREKLNDFAAEPHISFPDFIPLEKALIIARSVEAHIYFARIIKKWNNPRALHYLGFTSFSHDKIIDVRAMEHGSAGVIRFQKARFKTHLLDSELTRVPAYNLEIKRSSGMAHELNLLELAHRLAKNHLKVRKYETMERRGQSDSHFGYMQAALFFASQVFRDDAELSKQLFTLSKKWSRSSYIYGEPEFIEMPLARETAIFLSKHQILERMLVPDLYLD